VLLFFPLEYIRDEIPIANIVRFTNRKKWPINFKIKTTHPKDITSQPSNGSLGPGQSTDILLGWESQTALLGPTDFSTLQPPRQPKVLVEQHYVDSNGHDQYPPNTKVPVRFDKPGENDKYNLVIDGRVHSSFAKNKHRSGSQDSDRESYTNHSRRSFPQELRARDADDHDLSFETLDRRRREQELQAWKREMSRQAGDQHGTHPQVRKETDQCGGCIVL